MKTSFTKDEVHYISETKDNPVGIDWNNVNIGDTLDFTSGFVLMGTGFKNVSEAPNAEIEEIAYINQDAKSSIVKSYNNKWSGSVDKILDEKAVMILYNIGKRNKKGEDAERNLLIIDQSQPYGSEGKKYIAELNRVAVVIPTITKDAADKIYFDFELAGVKDKVFGVADMETKTFTVTDIDQPAPEMAMTEPDEMGI